MDSSEGLTADCILGGAGGTDTLVVGPAVTLDLTGAHALSLGNGATLTVNGTVNTEASHNKDGSEQTSNGRLLVGSAAANPAVINGNGIVYLRSKGFLLNIPSGKGVTIAGNVTLDGLRSAYDGVDNDSHIVNVGGTLTLNGGTIQDNSNTTSSGGGGVAVLGGGVFTLNSGAVSGNTALYGSGGGVIVSGTFTKNGGSVSGNIAENDCGALSNSGGIFTMSNGSVTGNNATDAAGGILVKGTFTMNNGIVQANSASTGLGGGVYISGNGLFTMNGGTIYGFPKDNNSNLTGSNGHALYKASGVAYWGTKTTTRTIGGASSGSPGASLIPAGNSVNGTIVAASP
jgi:hypothetical protein